MRADALRQICSIVKLDKPNPNLGLRQGRASAADRLFGQSDDRRREAFADLEPLGRAGRSQ